MGVSHWYRTVWSLSQVVYGCSTVLYLRQPWRKRYRSPPVILLDCSAGIGVRMDKTYRCGLGVRRTLGFLLLALAAGLLAGLSSSAQAPQGVPMARQAPVPRDAAGHPDISGYWELRYRSEERRVGKECRSGWGL